MSEKTKKLREELLAMISKCENATEVSKILASKCKQVTIALETIIEQENDKERLELLKEMITNTYTINEKTVLNDKGIEYFTALIDEKLGVKHDTNKIIN